jgi:hypothetical protein
MSDHIANVDNQCGGQPQHIAAILAELLAQYQRRFPAAGITVVQTPAIMEEHAGLLCAVEAVSAS